MVYNINDVISERNADMERLKILVVDDESRMRKLVRDFLVREDYEVCDDAEIKWLGSMQGDPGDIESTDHHADSQK